MRAAIIFLREFFERNLFERIVVYAFLSGFLVTLVFEMILKQWSFKQSQNDQWIFYGLLALDYLVTLPKVVKLRVSVNPMSMMALVFFVMVAQGLFVGIVAHNAPFVILNDTIPLLMIGLNILRMQSVAEFRPLDLRFLLKACLILACAACIAGYIAQLRGALAGPSPGSGTLFLPLLFASMIALRPFPKWAAVLGIAIAALTLPESNRTTLAFIALVGGGFVFHKMMKNPVMGVFAILGTVIIVSLAVAFLPPDSGLYKRVEDIPKIDLSKRVGSVGERQAEWFAIQENLKQKGPASQWLGMGFGGVYEVQFSHEYLTNYGHAHYSWSWFNLRFGRVGFIYLALMVSALIYNAAAQLRRRGPDGVFVSFVCLMGLVYCLTYVNAVFMLSGLHFFHAPDPRLLKPASGKDVA